MSTLEELRNGLPDPARDLKLNLQAVLDGSVLSQEQTWEIAVAVCITARQSRLLDAVRQEASQHLDASVQAPVLEDAEAAAALMGMNNIYYRFRHMIGKPSYGTMPAGLRMNRMARPAASKVDFELTCLAVSAVTGCEMCIQSHEKVVLEGGLTEAHVHAAVRLAAVLNGIAVVLG